MTDPFVQISSRLSALEAERDIADTINRYSHAIDYGLADEWLDCFTADGAIEVRSTATRSPGDESGSPPLTHVGRHAGREELLKFIRVQSRPPAAWHKHVVTQTRIQLDGESATATSYLIRVDEYAGRLQLYSMGRYIDTLVRSIDGRWRIAERIVDLELVSPAPEAPRRGEPR
ncbi:MAG: nuclear transport factor 2 family protein [Candidatus Dormiibacterota bacterium]